MTLDVGPSIMTSIYLTSFIVRFKEALPPRFHERFPYFMRASMAEKALLALENGLVLEGQAVGAKGTAVGELVFNTATSGYQEILTDPSYFQQLVMLTTPHIGNVGTNGEDWESARVWASGLVVRCCALEPSNWRSDLSLPAYLQKHGVVAIDGIDTRHLTHVLREHGAQKACITTELTSDDALATAKAFQGLDNQDLAQVVSTPTMYQWQHSRETWADAVKPQAYHVVAYDYGVKHTSLRLLVEAGCRVTVVNAKTPVEEVLALKPDGIFLSNGPGDPKACDYAIAAIQQLLSTPMPIFGICLGFQLLALALGARTVKMKFGHHGSNHPVLDLHNRRVLITSQNHSFMVDELSLPPEVTVTHRSLFDDTIQGLEYKQAFAFQGHPEASPGPHDLIELFQQFIQNMKNAKERMHGK